MALAALSLDSACLADRFQFAFQASNPFLHATPIDFQLRFARTTGADSAGLSRQVMPHARQSRQQVLQLRQFNLQPAFAAARALRENVENQLGAIKNFAREQVFQIASLCRRKLVIENY